MKLLILSRIAACTTAYTPSANVQRSTIFERIWRWTWCPTLLGFFDPLGLVHYVEINHGRSKFFAIVGYLIEVSETRLGRENSMEEPSLPTSQLGLMRLLWFQKLHYFKFVFLIILLILSCPNIDFSNETLSVCILAHWVRWIPRALCDEEHHWRRMHWWFP